MGTKKGRRGKVDVDILPTGISRVAGEKKKRAKPAAERVLEELIGLPPVPFHAIDCRYLRRCTSFPTKCGRCRHNRARDYFSPRNAKG